MAERRRSPWDRSSMVLAVVLGLAVGWLDIHTTEVSVTIGALLAAGVLCGLVQPRAPWRWAVALALGLPVVAAAARLAAVVTPEPIRLDPRVTVVAAAFALVGCYTGAFMRRALGTVTGAPPAS
jgi:hypothetical protein